MSTVTLDHVDHLIDDDVDRPLRYEIFRAKWDSLKTATHLRRVFLGCLVEIVGVFIYTTPVLCAVYGLMSSPSGLDQIKTPFLNIVTSLTCTLSVCLAVVVCMSSSRGYLHPSFTLMTSFTGLCSWYEAPFYIVSQIIGGFLSTTVVVGIYWDTIRPIWKAYKMGLLPEDKIWSSTGLLAGIINVKPHSRTWGPVFLNQTVECAMIAMVVSAALDSTNVFVAPTMVPLMSGAIFGLALLANEPGYIVDNFAIWIGGRTTCTFIFGRADLCFPKVDTLNVIFGGLPGYALGFLCYWLLLADIRRPSASTVMQQAELEAEAVAETAQRIHADTKALKAEKRAMAKLHEQQRRLQQLQNRGPQNEIRMSYEPRQHQEEQQIRQRLACPPLEHVQVAHEVQGMRMGEGPTGVRSAFRSSSPERLRSVRGHGNDDKEDDEVGAEGDDVFGFDQGRVSASVYSIQTTPSSHLERGMTPTRASQNESVVGPLPNFKRQ
ncbi:hypothetical protein OC846_002265 [Tilletia horrida]|uniref:Aquaporin n=1 Tax=Tilletia horrida TaxID=155126 RepID=A0AAN6GTZ6_9BASI|nr:hypothetical protein OC846_002265 [Tilletia horrida]KAK0568026.1 hypothetical protein OC861_002341 [Tilletia horrida]